MTRGIYFFLGLLITGFITLAGYAIADSVHTNPAKNPAEHSFTKRSEGLDGPEGRYFVNHINLTASASTYNAFLAERAPRASDEDPFVSEGQIYAAYASQFGELTSKSEQVQLYKEVRIELESLNATLKTAADRTFLFHAQKALYMVALSVGLFNRQQYLELFARLLATHG